MNDTTQHTSTAMDDRGNCSAGLEKNSCCELRQAMLFLCGESSSTAAANKASTAQCSEMSRRTKAANSFDKRTKLLIASGLVRGITPSSIRRKLGAVIPDFVSYQPDGESADLRKADY